MNASIAGLRIEPAHALGWDRAGARGKGIGHGEHRLPVLDRIEKSFADLERSAALGAGKPPDGFGINSVSAAHHEIGAKRPVRHAQARYEVAHRRVLLRVTGHNLDTTRIERAHGLERFLRHDHVTRGWVPIEDETVLVIGFSRTVPPQAQLECQTAVDLEAVLSVDSEFAVELCPVSQGIDTLAGKRQAQDEIRRAIARQ